MVYNKYSELVLKLENEESDITNSGPELVSLYTQLFALYLYENDLSSAKYLWKRIPQQLKTCKELEKLNQLFQSFRSNNTVEFFKNINYVWSDNIKDIMKDLEEKARSNIFILVANAYSTIYEHDLLNLSQLTAEQLKTTCENLGWTIDIDDQKVFFQPKKNESGFTECANSKNQLFTLTEFVSFLEN